MIQKKGCRVQVLVGVFGAYHLFRLLLALWQSRSLVSLVLLCEFQLIHQLVHFLVHRTVPTTGFIGFIILVSFAGFIVRFKDIEVTLS